MIPRVFLPKFLVCSLCFLLLGAQEVVAVQILGNLLGGLAGHHAVHLHNVVADAHNLRRLDLDVLGLALGAAHGLVDHYPGGGEGEAEEGARQEEGGAGEDEEGSSEESGSEEGESSGSESE